MTITLRLIKGSALTWAEADTNFTDLRDFLQSGSGAVTRTVQSKERDTKSVFDWFTQAQIDDVIARTQTLDVTAACNAAIAALASGTALRFPAGIYKLTGNLIAIPVSNVNIFGDGMQLTILKRTTFDTSGGIGGLQLGIFSATGKSFIEISGMTLQGTGAFLDARGVSPFAGKGTYFDACPNLYVHHCEIFNTNDAGIYCSGDCPNLEFSYNYVHENVWTGIITDCQFSQSDKQKINYNVCLNNGFGSIQVVGRSCEVIGNRISQPAAGHDDMVVLESVPNFIVANNIWENCVNNVSSVSLLSIINDTPIAAPDGGGGIITGNIMRNNNTGARDSQNVGQMEIHNSVNGNISITNNIIGENGTSTFASSAIGIGGTSTSAHISIQGNHFFKGSIYNQSTGISVWDTAATNKVSIGQNFYDSDVTTPVNCEVARGGAGSVTLTLSAAPVAGYWNVGDHVINSAPAVGQPKGWFCTVAGNPGTWVSEGNL